MNFHPGEDLLAHEPRLDIVKGSSIDEPWQIDGDWVALECGCIFRHVIRKEVVVVNLLPKFVLGLLPLSQVIVAVLQKVRLLVRGHVLARSLFVFFSVSPKIAIGSIRFVIGAEEICLQSSCLKQTGRTEIGKLVLGLSMFHQKLATRAVLFDHKLHYFY